MAASPKEVCSGVLWDVLGALGFRWGASPLLAPTASTSRILIFTPQCKQHEKLLPEKNWHKVSILIVNHTMSQGLESTCIFTVQCISFWEIFVLITAIAIKSDVWLLYACQLSTVNPLKLNFQYFWVWSVYLVLETCCVTTHDQKGTIVGIREHVNSCALHTGPGLLLVIVNVQHPRLMPRCRRCRRVQRRGWGGRPRSRWRKSVSADFFSFSSQNQVRKIYSCSCWISYETRPKNKQ